MSTIERPERQPHSLHRDRDLIERRRRELAADLAVRPADLDLLVKEELVTVLRETIERVADDA